jgi:AAA domain
LPQLVLGSSSQEENTQKFPKTIISPTGRSRLGVLVTVFQVLHTLRRINKPLWSVIYENLRCITSRESKRVFPRVVAKGPPGTGKTTTIVKFFSLLYHDTLEYCDPSPLQEQRLPSFRTLVCPASNTGNDQILSRWILNGVVTLMLDHRYGARAMSMIECAGPPTPSKIRMYHTLVAAPAFLAISTIGPSATALP